MASTASGLIATVLVLAVAVLLTTTGSPKASRAIASGAPRTYGGAVRRHASLAKLPLVTVGLEPTRPGTPVPRSFLGFSTEYWTLPLYAPRMPLFERAISLITVPGDGPPALRIGGDSSDHVLWHPRLHRMPRWAFELTPRWLHAARTLVRATAARLILDLNILTTTPREAGAWAHAALAALPRRSIVGFAIGNEDDIYDRLYWAAALGVVRASGLPLLPNFFSAARYIIDFRAYARNLARLAPGVPLVGPEVAEPARNFDWIHGLVASERPRLGLLSAHRYPYSSCVPRSSDEYATIGRVLSDDATVGVARSVGRAVSLARSAGLPFRLTELNSVTCGGLPGVSNTFATALWAPDAVFQLLRAGVSGLNIHTRAYAINAPFALTRYGLRARPLLYGLILAARALGPHGTLVRVRVTSKHQLHVKAWAVRVRGGALHVLLIDKGRRFAKVALHLPTTAPATIQRLLAPSVASRSGVTLAGQQLAPDGRWQGARVTPTVVPYRHTYVVPLPPYSAALITVPGARRPAATRTRPAGRRFVSPAGPAAR